MIAKAHITPVLAALARGPALVIPLVREVPAAQLQRRPAPGKWSVHEHACHLAAVQPVFDARLDYMLSHARPRIKPYLPEERDPDELLKMDLVAALKRFHAQRTAFVHRLRQLTPAQWAIKAAHPEYAEYGIFIMCRHLALHDSLHAYRIEELRLSRAAKR